MQSDLFTTANVCPYANVNKYRCVTCIALFDFTKKIE